MIKDSQANFLYLADTLPEKYPYFYSKLEEILRKNNVMYGLLPYTKDVWAVDYMPIQINPERFIQFKYTPDYLRNSKKWQHTISDVDKICDTLGMEREHSNIILDGGNVVKTEKSVIMCDKVFRENKNIRKSELIGQLKDLFEVDRLVFIPQDPEDYTGHADGMVRFINENSVLINNYRDEYHPKFQEELYNSLIKEDFEIEKLIYWPDNNSDNAMGLYMNFLEIGNFMLMPTYGEFGSTFNKVWEADEIAAIQLEEAYQKPDLKIIDSRHIAYDGGALNCISWKISIEV